MEIYTACEALLRTAAGTPESITALASQMVAAEFDTKSTARAAALASLHGLATAKVGCLSPAVGVLSPGLCAALGSSKSELRCSAALLVKLMAADSPGVGDAFAGVTADLAAALAGCVGGSDVRVQVDALNAVAALAALAPTAEAATALLDLAVGVSSTNAECVAAALRTASGIVALYGRSGHAYLGGVSPKTAQVLTQLLEGLKHDVAAVRATAIDALAAVAADSASGTVDLSSVAGPASSALSGLLQGSSEQTDRRRLVRALAAMAKTHAAAMDGASLLGVAGPLAGGADLQVSATVLELCGSLLLAEPKLAKEVQAQVWGSAFALLNNPALNATARDSVKDFCVSVVTVGASGFGFGFILSACTAGAKGKKVGARTAGAEIARHALKSLGVCIGAMAAAVPKESAAAASGFVKSLGAGKKVNAGDQTWTCEDSAVAEVVLALRSLGGMGAAGVDLSGDAALQAAVLECLEKHTSAEIRTAATDCLTSLCLGNVAAFSPFLAKAAQGGDTPAARGLQARVLQAVRELTMQAVGQLDRGLFVPILLQAANSPSPEVRLGVGQCLGNMMSDDGAIADFQARATGSKDGAEKQTIVTAMLHALKAGVEFDLAPFLALVDDDDLGVKEACLSLLNSAIRVRPAVALPLLSTHLEQVYKCARFYSNLVQVVDLGGMKHLVDRGLGLRRTAFEVLEALIFDGGEVSDVAERDLAAFIETVAQGYARPFRSPELRRLACS